VNKVGVIASFEFNSAVRTKAFLISIIMLPIIWGGAIAVQVLLRKGDTRPLAFAILDRTAKLYPSIESAAKSRNDGLRRPDGKLTEAPFVPSLEHVAENADPEARIAELSNRIKRGELYALIDIPPGAIASDNAGPSTIRYFSDTPTDDRLVNWLRPIVTAEIERIRFAAAGVDPAEIAKLRGFVMIESLSLTAGPAPEPKPVNASSPANHATPPPTVVQAQRVDPIRSFVVPAVLMFAVFMIVLSSTPLLMNSVMEEKMSKISEVLLGCVTPFELLLGKLIGNVGVSLILSALYLGGGYAVAAYYGYGNVVPPHLWITLALFLVLAVLLFGSMFSAVGAACSDLKDAQSLMLPVMLLVMLPAFLWTAVIQSPSSALSVGASLFPPATPFLMLLRMALRPEPPVWQVALSILLTTLTALAVVWAAGRILRIGLLSYGKAPSFAQLAKWVFSST
jgi:ABC-type Na+ efflux pump permease subunit